MGLGKRAYIDTVLAGQVFFALEDHAFQVTVISGLDAILDRKLTENLDLGLGHTVTLTAGLL